MFSPHLFALSHFIISIYFKILLFFRLTMSHYGAFVHWSWAFFMSLLFLYFICFVHPFMHDFEFWTLLNRSNERNSYPAQPKPQHPSNSTMKITLLETLSDTSSWKSKSWVFCATHFLLYCWHALVISPDVEFCGYSIPHPSEAKLNLRIQTYGKPSFLSFPPSYLLSISMPLSTPTFPMSSLSFPSSSSYIFLPTGQ